MRPETLPSTVPGLVAARAASDPGAIASYHHVPGTGWVPTTWSELEAEVGRLAASFQRLGLERGDRFAIVARTCREWQLAELAGLANGSVIVGLDAHSAAEQVGTLMEHAQASAALVDTLENARKIPPAIRRRLKFLAVLDPLEPGDTHSDVVPWAACTGADGATTSPERRPGPAAGDPATLIYTSGTTGAPKAIEYTHGQMMLACQAILGEFAELATPHTVLCWLPMAPLFQRMLNLVACASGATTYFVDDPRRIMEAVREVRPTVFVAVPRFYEKLHQAIEDHVRTGSPWRRRLIHLAMATGARRARLVRAGERPPRGLALAHAVFDRLVLHRMRAVMGGRIEWMISGSAPTAPWLLEYFHGLGLLVLEAYGLSENIIPVAANRPAAYRFGSVGRPFAMNEIRIDEGGQLLIKGPGVFRRYHRAGHPDDGFTPDGYYRTGDYAHLDPDGYLFLVGREAEIIKTSTGHRIAPAGVEAVYRRSRYVDHVVVVGGNRKHLVGLVTLNVAAVEHELARAGLAAPRPAQLAALPFVESLVGRDLEECGSRLAPFERAQAFAILPEPLTVEGGDLTTSLKLRRGHIERKYGLLIDGLYANRPATVPAQRDALARLKV